MAVANAIRVRQLFKEAGFTIAEAKSMNPEESCTKVKYLGFMIDSVKMEISASTDKLDEVLALVNGGLTSWKLPVREWAKLRGTLVSLSQAIGPRAITCSRPLANEITDHERVKGWGDKHLMSISDTAKRGLSMLLSLKDWNGQPIRNELNALQLSAHIPGDNLSLIHI